MSRMLEKAADCSAAKEGHRHVGSLRTLLVLIAFVVAGFALTQHVRVLAIDAPQEYREPGIVLQTRLLLGGQNPYSLVNQPAYTNIYGIQKLYTPVTNLNNWLQNVGPSSPRHILNLSAIVEAPYGIRVALISSFNSRQPFQPIITGTDFYGTGVDQFLLPGSGTNQFNFGLGKGDMTRLVDQYNQTYAGKNGPNPAQTFPRVTLPANFDTGDVFNSQDVRVTKLFRFHERLEWQVFGEVFNLFNTANLSGYVDNLLAPGFGQPSARFSNVFGTGGPRSFQLGTRLSF